MKIRFFSDLHLEFLGLTVPVLPDDADTLLIIAGDLCSSSRPVIRRGFLNQMSEQFREVVYIPGNHEYYGGNFTYSWDELRGSVSDLPNVHCLNNGAVEVEGYLVIGSTLWSDFDKESVWVMQQAGQCMNDYRMCTIGADEQRLQPQDTLDAHHQSVKYLWDTLNRADKPAIVVTHHGPSWRSVHNVYKGDGLNGAYVSALDTEILDLGDKAPELWIHGHVHTTFSYKIGKTWVRTNPRGYAKIEGHQENREFDPELTMIMNKVHTYPQMKVTGDVPQDVLVAHGGPSPIKGAEQ